MFSTGTIGIISLLLIVPAIMISTTVHEATRAAISTLFGDDTPRREKRLTLNPFKHFEPIGFLLILTTGMRSAPITMPFGYGCGWGKPVNTNARNYQNRTQGAILVAVMPSVANFAVAVASSFAIKHFTGRAGLSGIFFELLMTCNISLIAYNFLPVVPFDCLKVVNELVSRKTYFTMSQSESAVQLLLMFMLFMGWLAKVMNPFCDIIRRLVLAVTL